MNNNLGEKYLPIGTVVMLKGGTKRLMITGFCSIAKSSKLDNANEKNSNVIYDYTGVLYPEGIISSDQTALFNHDQISQIYHLGLIDEEEVKFKTRLKELVDKIAKNGIPNINIDKQANNQKEPEEIDL